jgi:hypothetical protein
LIFIIFNYLLSFIILMGLLIFILFEFIDYNLLNYEKKNFILF